MNTIKIDSGRVKMVAHRGLSGIERENTAAAFTAAGNRSYFGIETDIHVTGDGKIIAIHDETLDRVSLDKYNLNVEKVPFSELESIILPDRDGTFSRRDIVIPTLSDYVSICKKYEKICVLELKNPFAEADIKRVIEEIDAHDYLDGIIYISFSWENCIILRKLLPEAKIQWLTSFDVTDEKIEELRANNLDLDIYYKKLDKALIDKLHDKGITVNCWTCDDPEEAKKLVGMGVDFITSNILE